MQKAARALVSQHIPQPGTKTATHAPLNGRKRNVGYLIDVVVVDESGRETFNGVLGQLYK